MVSQKGKSNTQCFLLPLFQGEIKAPAMRVNVDFSFVASFHRKASFLRIFFMMPAFRSVILPWSEKNSCIVVFFDKILD
jgi:hypothetical protein